MKYFLIESEVAGGLGEHTKMDTSTHPPLVSELHYVFEGWSDDALLTSFPCFIVTSKAKQLFEEAQFTGLSFDVVETSKSDNFIELYPAKVIPEFSWLKISGGAGVDDFWIDKNCLIISERVLDVLLELGLQEAIITEFEIAGPE
ncbi:MAG TPA: hypothetical protein VN030_06420 [Cellvibrio sp.]|nr:hypothetical protein [Cellvibrio sp.]